LVPPERDGGALGLDSLLPAVKVPPPKFELKFCNRPVGDVARRADPPDKAGLIGGEAGVGREGDCGVELYGGAYGVRLENDEGD
jgi:hypothetical protein